LIIKLILSIDELTDAKVNVTRMFEEGTCVAQDYTEAVRWFRLAAAQGNAKALQMLRLAVAQSMQPLRSH